MKDKIISGCDICDKNKPINIRWSVLNKNRTHLGIVYICEECTGYAIWYKSEYPDDEYSVKNDFIDKVKSFKKQQHNMLEELQKSKSEESNGR